MPIHLRAGEPYENNERLATTTDNAVGFESTERMAAVKLAASSETNVAEMGGVYHLSLVVDDQIPDFKKVRR